MLNERGHVDLDHIAELLHRDVDDVLADLGASVFRDPANGNWLTADAYLSGPVRDKLKLAEAVAEGRGTYQSTTGGTDEDQRPQLV